MSKRKIKGKRGSCREAKSIQHKKRFRVKKKEPNTKPDWGHNCMVCDETPILPVTGMCGPCTFGEAETAGGNW
jgi:hypothetical protein